MDEALHAHQISNFLRGDFSLYSRLEMFPTFHFLFALWAKLWRSDAAQTLRSFSFCWDLALFVVLWRAVEKEKPQERTWMLIFLPLLFPFLLLVYTDIPALVFLVAAFSAAKNTRPVLSCLSLSLACAFRQNHLSWFPFFMLMCAHFEGTRFADVPRKYWYFIVSFSLFLAICYFQGGVSLHVPPGVANVPFHPGNIIFLLALLPCIFLPLIAEHAGRIRSELRSAKIVCLVCLAIVWSFVSFAAPHPFNHFAGHLRTYFFIALDYDPLIKIAFAALTGAGALFLLVLPIERRVKLVLILSSFISLYPLKLIEVRYFFPPLILGVLLMEAPKSKYARMQICYGAALSLLMFYGAAEELWFW